MDIFLEETKAIDLWRHIYDHKPGFTYKNDSNTSFSRIDYFLLSPALFGQLEQLDMSIGNWNRKLDHARLSLLSQVSPVSGSPANGKPWSIPQPRLSLMSPEQQSTCKSLVREKLIPLLQSINMKELSLDAADQLSQTLARIIVDETVTVVGSKLPTHEKGKYQSLARAEITTIEKARDLIRRLYLDEFKSQEDRVSTENHLSTLLDRLCRMGLNSVPRVLSLDALHKWAEVDAPMDLETLRWYIQVRKETMAEESKQKSRKQFLDPKKRGKWFERIFGAQRSTCPNFAIDSKTGKRRLWSKKLNRFISMKGRYLSKTSNLYVQPLTRRSKVLP